MLHYRIHHTQPQASMYAHIYAPRMKTLKSRPWPLTMSGSELFKEEKDDLISQVQIIALFR